MNSETKQEEHKQKRPVWLLLALLAPMYLLHQALLPEARLILSLPKDELKLLAPFALGVGLAIFFVASNAMEGLLTILHELRHAAVVILTGHQFTKIVFYTPKERKEHKVLAKCFYYLRKGTWGRLTQSLIAVAPYSFPLLTLPTMICVMWITTTYQEIALFAVGIASGVDIGGALRDFFNTNNLAKGDFNSIKFGFLIGAPFCIVANLLVIDWVSIWLYRLLYEYSGN
jgi:hypothetical protein